jgi:hypothetical protein
MIDFIKTYSPSGSPSFRLITLGLTETQDCRLCQPIKNQFQSCVQILFVRIQPILFLYVNYPGHVITVFLSSYDVSTVCYTIITVHMLLYVIMIK